MSAVAKHAVILAAAMAWAGIGDGHAQDIGFGLADAYRYYADPGNGGGSAYAPFFDPYRGNRIVRGAYPDAYYDGYGYHYGKAAPPSLTVEPPFDSGSTLRLREGETRTTPVGGFAAEERAIGIRERHRPCGRGTPRHPSSRRCVARAR